MNVILNQNRNRVSLGLTPKEFTILRRALFLYYLASMGEAPTEDLQLVEELNDKFKEIK